MVIYFNNLFVHSLRSHAFSLSLRCEAGDLSVVGSAQMRLDMNVLWKSAQLSHVMLLCAQQVIRNGQRLIFYFFPFRALSPPSSERNM